MRRGELSTPEGRVRYIAVPVRAEGSTRGVFVITSAVGQDAADVTEAIQVAAGVALVVLVLVSIIGFVAAGRVLAPLRELDSAAKAIGSSDLTQRIEVEGHDEIAELGRTFNAMLDRLEAAFSTQRDFISDASHELRTPITIIRGHLEVLGDDPDERRETIALVTDELDRMGRFVNDLLTLAKAGRPDFLRMHDVDVDELTEELMAKASALAPRRWELGGIALGQVRADRQRLTQAMMSLAQNAVEHTSEGDRIAIGSELEPRRAAAVGRGRRAGDRARRPGARVRALRPRRRGAALRGRRPRAGDRARHRRGPRRPRDPAQRARRGLALHARAARHRRPPRPRADERHVSRILIVEDEARLASFLEKGLSAAGFVTKSVGDGPSALALALTEDFDLVVLDLGLPKLDGVEVLRALRASDRRVPVIILSARDELDEKVQGLELGADDYVTKPFRFEELLARIRVRLRSRGSAEPTVLSSGPIALDLRARRATVGDREVELSAREFALLEVFLRHPGQVLSREQLLSRVWGFEFDPGSNVVDVYVGYLRRKLGAEHFATVRGAGYRLSGV